MTHFSEQTLIRINKAVLDLHEASSKEELLLGLESIFTIESLVGFTEEVIAIADGRLAFNIEGKVKTLDGKEKNIHLKWAAVDGYEDTLGKVYISTTDITDRKRDEEIIEKRIIALTRPLNDASNITFEELFSVSEIQKLQDSFANATGVASIITDLDGKPITKQSNFCELCNIIRKTEKGLANCFKSDAIIGGPNPTGVTIHPCYSGGLWDAGIPIKVGKTCC